MNNFPSISHLCTYFFIICFEICGCDVTSLSSDNSIFLHLFALCLTWSLLPCFHNGENCGVHSCWLTGPLSWAVDFWSSSRVVISLLFLTFLNKHPRICRAALCLLKIKHTFYKLVPAFGCRTFYFEVDDVQIQHLTLHFYLYILKSIFRLILLCYLGFLYQKDFNGQVA